MVTLVLKLVLVQAASILFESRPGWTKAVGGSPQGKMKAAASSDGSSKKSTKKLHD